VREIDPCHEHGVGVGPEVVLHAKEKGVQLSSNGGDVVLQQQTGCSFALGSKGGWVIGTEQSSLGDRRLPQFDLRLGVAACVEQGVRLLAPARGW